MSGATFAAGDYRGTGPENYERFFVPAIGAPMADDLLEAAALRPGERVLDVACGTGHVTRRAATEVGAGGSVAGLDINPGMLSVARAVTPKTIDINWHEANAEAMGLPDASVDVVLCQMGLQFMPDKLQVLREIRRVLTPGGRLVLNLPGPTPEPMAELAQALAQHIDPRCGGFVHVVFSLHDPDALRGLMSDAGFQDIQIDRIQKVLSLPEPQEFLWQYIHSTPLAEPVANATDAQRSALADDIATRWQRFAPNGKLSLEVGMTTASAT